jgi:uncharacterized membrane protein (UPF0127 family)
VYNQTRESFLSLGVTVADTHLSRLRGLLGKLRLKSDEGLWIVPCQGVHTIGLLFPIDLIYLDEENRVVHLVEHFGTFRIAPIRTDSASVLEMQTRTIYSSHTQIGDQFVICSAEEMTLFCNQKESSRAPDGSARSLTAGK